MSNTPPNDALQLSPEEMRTLGYQVINILIEHFEQLRNKPVTRMAHRPLLLDIRGTIQKLENFGNILRS